MAQKNSILKEAQKENRILKGLSHHIGNTQKIIAKYEKKESLENIENEIEKL